MSEATGKGKAASADGDQAPEHNLTSSMTENTKRYVFIFLVAQVLTSPRSIEIFSSPPFKFVVGPERTEFMIHSKLLERLSQPLHNLMNNGTMTESREHVACLKDIDTQTFSDFVDFAYAFASVSDSTLEVEKEADGWWGYGNFFDSLSTSCAKHRCTSIPEDVGTFHIACDTGQSHTSSDVIEALLQDQRDVTGIMSSLYGLAMNYVAEKDRKCDEGPRAYLTSAGKLYVFADRYLVGGLKLVALHKLRKDFFAVPYRFSEVPYSPRSVEDFLELLDLAFEDGITDEKDESRITDLQMLVILIALHKHEVLKESKAFWEALSHNSHIGMAVFFNIDYAVERSGLGLHMIRKGQGSRVEHLETRCFRCQ